MSAPNFDALRQRIKELETQIAILAEIYLAAVERRKDEEFMMAEALTKTVRACSQVSIALPASK